MRGPLCLFLVVVALAGSDADAARSRKKRGAPVLVIRPGSARPGDVVSITVNRTGPTPEGKLGPRPLYFHPIKGGYRALVPLSVDLRPGKLDVDVRIPPPPPPKKRQQKRRSPPPPLQLSGELEIVAPNFNKRELRVARKFVDTPPSVRKQVVEDRKAFKKAFDQKDLPPLFNRSFAWPRKALITAPFGDLRTYNGRKQSQHYGMDLQGRVGDPIYAANDGVVVLVRDAYGSGRTVLIHHGARLYTAYFHLSAYHVKQGQKVKRGQRVGKVGMTGRVTGPHLHFAVKLDGYYVDPHSLLRLRL